MSQPPNILFPCSPLSRATVDPHYTSEAEAALAAGFVVSLYSHEQIEGGDAVSAVSQCRASVLYIFRGWMLTEPQYRLLAHALLARGGRLYTSPEAYVEAHYLPLSYPFLQGVTPLSSWCEGDRLADAWQLYQKFRDEDSVIKDWVKSAKHRWNDACYIPAHTTEERFAEIFHNFREARGHLFNRGVVLRRYEKLVTKGQDLRGFPLVEEYRLFFYRHRLLAHPEFPGVEGVLQHLGLWTGLAARFLSPFLSMDIAQREAGDWIVIEVGDGGVSGLPLSIDPQDFYTMLYKAD